MTVPPNSSLPDVSTERVTALLKALTLAEKISLMSGQDFWSLPPIPRLGIPSLVVSDGPTGLRSTNSEPATVFPVGVAMAASWNDDLAREVGSAIAREAIAYGVDVLLAPAINIQRTPLGGRNFETYSEDPHLAGDIAAAYIEGVQSQGVGTSLKHYAANNQEHERMRGSSNMSQRVLREIYLAAFEKAIHRSNPWTIMSAYNRVNGTYSSEHRQLLTDILRDEWGYDGVVVSDWGAAKSTIASVRNGLDLEMPGPGRHYGQPLEHAVATGEVDETDIDVHVRRILKLILRAGLLDNNPKASRAALNTPEHRSLARRAAAESIVLLKNKDACLPLKQSQRIAVIGAPAHRPTIQGGGSSQVSPFRIVSPLDAMRETLTGWDFAYAQGIDHEASAPVIDARLLRDELGEEGLTARYYTDNTFSGDSILVERDWRFFKLGFGKAAQTVEAPDFAVEWTGTFTPERDGNHEFVLSHTSPHVELYLDGTPLIDAATPADTEMLFMFLQMNVSRASRDLEAGRAYPICIRYSQPAEGAIPGFNVFSVSLRPPAPSFEDAVALAADSDVAVIFAGSGSTSETEGCDRQEMALDAGQTRLIESVASACPKTVVVLNIGAPVEMPWADKVDAILLSWLPGQEGGYAVADLLSGKLSPSGKLPVTFPKAYRDNPTWLYYPGGSQADYGEGLFVGYRYYDSADIAPLFPFGHGLTYSHFEIDHLSVPDTAQAGDTVTVSLRLKNVGDCCAQETVQVYVEDCATQETCPIRQLRAFRKVRLEPGEECVLQFELQARAFSWFDTDKNDWSVTSGRYVVHAGFSSRDLHVSAPIELIVKAP